MSSMPEMMPDATRTKVDIAHVIAQVNGEFAINFFTENQVMKCRVKIVDKNTKRELANVVCDTQAEGMEAAAVKIVDSGAIEARKLTPEDEKEAVIADLKSRLADSDARMAAMEGRFASLLARMEGDEPPAAPPKGRKGKKPVDADDPPKDDDGPVL